MHHDQIVDLLKAAAAYDNRKPDPASVLAWGEAARRGGWDFAAALDAIHAHYCESSDRIMPGHVTQRLRLSRRQPDTVEHVLPRGPGSSAEHRASVVADFARKLAERNGIT